MRFGTRLALFLVFALVAVQGLTVAVAYHVTRTQLVEQGEERLRQSAKLFDRQLNLVSARVADGVEVLALDFPLREAIAKHDLPTVESALRNHGERVGAKRMVLIDLDGAIASDTSASEGRTQFRFTELLDMAADEGIASGMAVIDGTLNWVIVAPVNAPTPIAYIAASVPINDALVNELQALSALPTSLRLVTSDTKGRLTTLARGGREVNPDGEHLVSRFPLPVTPGSASAFAVFDYPLALALRPFESVLVPLLAVFLAGLMTAAAGAILIARNVSRPIEELAKQARLIAAGDYTPLAPLKAHGEIKQLSDGLGSMARTIGEREDKLHHAIRDAQASRDEAVRANSAKSEFLANMSHEIRTPLNAVLGLAGVLIDTPLSAEQKHQVALIKESGDNLLDLLNDILDLSKLDAGQVEIEHVAFDVVSLCEGAIDLLRHRAAEKRLNLAFDCGVDVPRFVTADSSRIRQILINLTGNAIKFTQKGGVAIHLKTIERRAGTATIEWSVTDTGIGIAPDRITHLFQDFMQADSSIARRFGGSGLGLAICKRLVERMNGSIQVQSELGKGSTFSFRLPVRTAAAGATDTAPTHETRSLSEFVRALGRSVRILVVEDNVTNQFVARSILKAEGVTVDVAANGREALEAVSRHPYDLVFMDVQMPEMDGLTATRELRARGDRYAALPIIGFSANAFASDIEACRKAGMNGHVAKPVQKETLCAAVVDVLSGRMLGASTAPPSSLGDGDVPDLDRRAIDALIDGLTATVVNELLVSFVVETKAKLERLPALLEKTERLTIEVHSLKSASAQMGAAKLSRLAASLERQAGDGEAVSTEVLTELKTAFDRYCCDLYRERLVVPPSASLS